MQLVERYLQAVKFWLPKQQKDDILAELSADIQSQIEDRESTLGRTLNDAEIEDILKQRGRPCVVASKFRPQESLIGPVLYPIYLFCLKCALAGYLVPWTLVTLAILILRPTFSASQSVPAWFMTLATVSGHLWNMAFLASATITLIFAILERVQAKSHWLENWSPRKLPAVRDDNKNARTNAAFELAIISLAIVWWASYIDTTAIYLGESVRFDLKLQWLWFFWGYLTVLLATAAIAAYSLFRPTSARFRAAMHLPNSILGGILFCWLLKANIVTAITAPNLSAQKSIEITNGLNHWMVYVFPYGVVVSFVIAAIDVYRLVRARPTRS